MSDKNKVNTAVATLKNAGVVQKRGPGRPKGSKTKGYYRERANAKALYLVGYPPDEIAKQTGVTENTIEIWAKKYGWVEERNSVQEKLATDKLNILMKNDIQTFEELKEMRDKAFKSIKKNSVFPSKFSESVNAYISVLELEIKIKSEALQISFITGLANILREEIQDRELLQKIAIRCMDYFEKQKQQRNVINLLKSGDKDSG